MNLRRLTFLFVVILVGLPGLGYAEDNQDLLHYYQSIQGMLQRGIKTQVLFQERIGDWNVSLRGPQKNEVVIGTFSKDKAKSMEWLFIFDRNHDGKFDYMCWPIGPMFIKQPDFPSDFPKKDEKLTAKQTEYLYKSMRPTFAHISDENYDSKIDALVLPDCDPDRPGWVDKWAVLLSSKNDGILDEAWFFTNDINERQGTPERTEKGFKVVYLDGKAKEYSGESLSSWNEMLGWFNKAAADYQSSQN